MHSLLMTVIGQTPLFLNRVSEKARRELLLPGGRKTNATKAATLKHDPLAEFRASPYVLSDPNAPTLLAVPGGAFKGAMATAALDLPGTNRQQIGRLVRVPTEYVAIYGLPKLHMTITRNADMNHTPDVRTRCCVPQWAAQFEVWYAVPLLKPASIGNLLVTAGSTCGVGDWRPEKGKGDYGCFAVVDSDDERFLSLKAHGRAVQLAAMNDPEPYDQETGDLLAWYGVEIERRVGTLVDEPVSANGTADESDESALMVSV